MDLVEPPKTEISHVRKIGNVINSLTHRSDKHVNLLIISRHHPKKQVMRKLKVIGQKLLS